MEKNISTIEKKKVSELGTLLGENSPNHTPAFLVFLIDLEDLEIFATNGLARNYLSKPSAELSISLDAILHPEDLATYYDHLESCKILLQNEEKITSLRLKSPNGAWELFSFHYRVFPNNSKKILLATAKKIATDQDSCKNSHLKGLLHGNEQYATLVNSLDEGYFAVEMIVNLNNEPLDFLVLEANPAFENQASYVNPVGRTIGELTNTSSPSWIQTLQKVAVSREPLRFQQQAKDNWFNIYAFPVDALTNDRLAVLFTNITRERDAEEKLKKVNEYLEEKVLQRTVELKENSDLLQTIFDTTNQGIIVFEPVFNGNEFVDFQYLMVNKVITDLYQNENLVGCTYLEINPDAKEIGVFQKLEASILTGEAKDFEIYYDRQGYNKWFRLTSRPVNELLIVSMEDITQQKLEAQRLRESIRFKKHLTRASPDIIMIFNLYDENIRYINRDMASFPGMRRRDILGKQLPEIVSFIHPSDREKAMKFHKKLLLATDKDVLEFEFRLRSSKGSYQWYNALGKVFMRNKNAKVYEYMLLLRNIDQQIETKKALTQAENLSIKGEIARTLAHELRNPMASIGMATDILSQKVAKEEGENLQKYLGIIKRSTKVLNDLVSELLTSSNYSPAVLKKNCLATILEEALQQAKDRIYLSGIQVVKEYKGQYYIKADDEKLKIALLNIIVNASEAMDPNEGLLRLGITRVEDNFTLTITDNGCGLEHEQLDKLFDAFYSHRQGGIGVGLNAVKNILEEHDATIEVESEINKGTTFHLTFHCHDNF